MIRNHSQRVFLATFALLAFVSLAPAMAPSPNLSAGKTKVQNGTTVAYNIGGGYSRLLWYWSVGGPFGSNALPSYQIQTSANSTNGTDGSWTTVKTVSGNGYNSREHTFDFAGMTWVRMYNAGGLTAPTFVEVHDVSRGCEDTWFFLGNSITEMSYNRTFQPDYQTNIAAKFPSYSPVMIDGGIGTQRAANGVTAIDAYLADFPDMKYWAIEYGTNEAWNNVPWNTITNPTGYEANMQILVDKILAAGRIPIFPQIPYSTRGSELTTIPVFNAAIDSLTRRNSLIGGPDLYAYFKAHPEELDNSFVHPNDTGAKSLNRLWANTMATVPGMYSESGIAVSAFRGTPALFVNSSATPVAFSVNVFPSTGNTVGAVTLDLSPLGGSPAVTMVHGTGNSYSYTHTVPAGTASGGKTIRLISSDNQNHHDTAAVVIRVKDPGFATTAVPVYADAQSYPGLEFSGPLTEATTGAFEGTKSIHMDYAINVVWGTTSFNKSELVVNGGAGIIDMSGQDSLRLAYKSPNQFSFDQFGIGLRVQGVAETYTQASTDVYYLAFSSTSWKQVSVPLKFFSDHGKDLSRIVGITFYVIGYGGAKQVSFDNIQLLKNGSTAAKWLGPVESVRTANTIAVSVVGRSVSFSAMHPGTLRIYDLAGNLVDAVHVGKKASVYWQAHSAGVFIVKNESEVNTSRIMIK